MDSPGQTVKIPHALPDHVKTAELVLSTVLAICASVRMDIQELIVKLPLVLVIHVKMVGYALLVEIPLLATATRLWAFREQHVRHQFATLGDQASFAVCWITVV